jgi:hypothetical protein
MKQLWFKRTGWWYKPIHPLGYGVCVLALIFMVPVVIAVDSTAHSVTGIIQHFYLRYLHCLLVEMGG